MTAPTPDVARAEELLRAMIDEAYDDGVEQRNDHSPELSAARSAVLSLVRDLARERDRIGASLELVVESRRKERARAEAAEASLSRVRSALSSAEHVMRYSAAALRNGGGTGHEEVRLLEGAEAAARSLASSAPGAPAEPARDDGGCEHVMKWGLDDGGFVRCLKCRRTSEDIRLEKSASPMVVKPGGGCEGANLPPAPVSSDPLSAAARAVARMAGRSFGDEPGDELPCGVGTPPWIAFPGSSSSAEPIVCPRCKVKNWDRKAAEAHARWCAAPPPGAQGEEAK
jgi:hypothetical protein